LTASIRRRVRSVPPLVRMVLITFPLHLTVIAFDTIENLMGATHLHTWEHGNVNDRDSLSRWVPMDAGPTTTQHEDFAS